MFKCGMDFPVSDSACQFRLVVIGSLHSCAGVFINSCGLSHYKCIASYTHISAAVAVRTRALPVDVNRWVPVVRTSISVIPGRVLLLKVQFKKNI